MTREEAKEFLYSIACNLGFIDVENYTSHDGKKMCDAIKTLDQESIFDKVKDEIMDTGAYEQEVNGETEFLKGINYCLEIIDKYKAEMESEE